MNYGDARNKELEFEDKTTSLWWFWDYSRPKIDKHRLSKSLDGIVQFNSRDGPRVAEDWVPRLSDFRLKGFIPIPSSCNDIQCTYILYMYNIYIYMYVLYIYIQRPTMIVGFIKSHSPFFFCFISVSMPSWKGQQLYPPCQLIFFRYCWISWYITLKFPIKLVIFGVGILMHTHTNPFFVVFNGQITIFHGWIAIFHCCWW